MNIFVLTFLLVLFYTFHVLADTLFNLSKYICNDSFKHFYNCFEIKSNICHLIFKKFFWLSFFIQFELFLFPHVTSDFLLKFGHFCIVFWVTGSYLNLCLSRLSLTEFCRRGRHCLFFVKCRCHSGLPTLMMTYG